MSGTGGTDGTNGTNGADGADGADGMNGTDGTDGTNGTNGHTALAVTSTESPGTNCADGGIKIEVGVDDNDDGALQASEIDQTIYVCDGANGADGTNGTDGADGADGTNGSASASTMLTSISTPTLTACDAGGRVIKQGLDNGDGGGTAQNGILESGEVDYTTTYCSNYLLGMVKDINSGSTNSSPQYLTAIGNTLYFKATDGTNGYELWKSDGTSSGTVMVKDINSGSSSSIGTPYFTAIGNTLYFKATDGTNGYELWCAELASYGSDVAVHHEIAYS